MRSSFTTGGLMRMQEEWDQVFSTGDEDSWDVHHVGRENGQKSVDRAEGEGHHDGVERPDGFVAHTLHDQPRL